MLLAIGPLVALFTMFAAEPDAPFRVAKLLYTDDFRHGITVQALDAVLQLVKAAARRLHEEQHFIGPREFFFPDIAGSNSRKHIHACCELVRYGSLRDSLSLFVRFTRHKHDNFVGHVVGMISL